MPKRPTMSDRKAETPRVAARIDTALMGQERDRREVVELLIDEIMPNRRQPRQQFDQASLAELADSIRAHGVLEPVLVRAIPLTLYEGGGRQYELIAGERRWRAASLAARRTVPALVLPETTSDDTTLELAIVENLQREDLHPLDEAAAFGRMQRELGYSYAQIAARLGKSKGYVQNRLRLIQLDADLHQLVAERPDTLTHVYELARLADPAQRAPLVAAVRDDQLSFAETRARVQAALAPAAEPEPAAVPEHSSQASNPVPRLREAGLIGDPAQPLAGLDARERGAFSTAVAQVERLLEQPARLQAADWALIEQLALRLAELLDARDDGS